MAQKLTPLEVREKLRQRGYDLTKHSNHMAAIHAVLHRIREPKDHRIGTLATEIREILREAEEL